MEQKHTCLNLLEPVFIEPLKLILFLQQHNVEQIHTVQVSRERAAQENTLVFKELMYAFGRFCTAHCINWIFKNQKESTIDLT